MVTLFSEEDMASFGNYMISGSRKKSIKENPEIKDNQTRKMLLGVVTRYDLQNWMTLTVQADREKEELDMQNQMKQFQAAHDEEDLIEEGTIEEDSIEGNTIQMNPYPTEEGE